MITTQSIPSFQTSFHKPRHGGANVRKKPSCSGRVCRALGYDKLAAAEPPPETTKLGSFIHSRHVQRLVTLSRSCYTRKVSEVQYVPSGAEWRLLHPAAPFGATCRRSGGFYDGRNSVVAIRN
jgi:hypothetical protein